MAQKIKPKPKGYTLAMHFAPEELEEVRRIEAEARKFTMKPTDYVRRSFRIGRQAALKNPLLLLDPSLQEA